MYEWDTGLHPLSVSCCCCDAAAVAAAAGAVGDATPQFSWPRWDPEQTIWSGLVQRRDVRMAQIPVRFQSTILAAGPQICVLNDPNVQRKKISFISQLQLNSFTTYIFLSTNQLSRDYNCDSTTIQLISDYDVSRAPASIRRDSTQRVS